MTQEKKQQQEQSQKGKEGETRQIIIETDGNTVNIIKAEVAGKLEMLAVLQQVIGYINNQK